MSKKLLFFDLKIFGHLKRNIFLLFLLGGLTNVTTKALAEPSSPSEAQSMDKLAHISVSAMGVASMERSWQLFLGTERISFTSRALSSAAMLSVGYLKGRRDAARHSHKFDHEDMAANIIGVMFGNLIVWEF